jgi:hypothetical protein
VKVRGERYRSDDKISLRIGYFWLGKGPVVGCCERVIKGERSCSRVIDSYCSQER